MFSDARAFSFVATFVVVFALSGSVGEQQRQEKKPLPKRCDHIDRTKPPQLKGAIDTKAYQFTWLSDVEAEQGVFTYVRILKNEHTANILPVEWEKASLSFSEIPPRDCGRNNFQSQFAEKEDSKTIIRYGSKLDASVPASLHVLSDKIPGALRGAVNPGLVKGLTPDRPVPSRLAPINQPVPNRRELRSEVTVGVVGVSFSSVVERGNVTYEAQNLGQEAVRLRIEMLDEHVKLWPKHGKVGIKDWQRENGALRLDYESRNRAIITFSEDEFTISEKQLVVSVESRDTQKPLAKGLVTCYLLKAK